MSSDDRDPGPDLELPSLFGRRRKKAKDGAAPPAAPDEPTEELPVTARPVDEHVGADAPTQPLRPVAGAVRRPPTAPPPDAPPAAPPVTPPADVPVAPAAVDQPVVEQPVVEQAEPVEPPSARPPRPTGPPPRRRGPDMSWPVAEAPAGPAARVDVAEPPVETADQPHEETPERTSEGVRRRPSLPSIDLKAPSLAARPAAALAGVAVAVAGIALVWGSLQACTAVRGVSTCGGIGLLAIVLTLVAQVAVGVLLLGALDVAQARSTAVLGVGIASFVAMLLLYASLSGVALSLALLLVTPAAYVVAEGVTSGRFAEPPERPS